MIISIGKEKILGRINSWLKLSNLVIKGKFFNLKKGIYTHDTYRKQITKMANINLTLSKIILHVNGLNIPIKRCRLTEWTYNYYLTICSSKRHNLESKIQIGWK